MTEDKPKIPTGWRFVNLGDETLVTIIMGQSPPGESYNKDKYGLPFYQGKADFGRIYPEPSVWCTASKKIAEPNDILLSVRAPVGPTNIAKEKCCIGRGFAAIRCKEEMFNMYLLLVLRNFEIHISQKGAGSIFDAIGADEIKTITFPIPPTIDEQMVIANDLEKRIAEAEKIKCAAKRQLEAVSALPATYLREFFSFAGVQHG